MLVGANSPISGVLLVVAMCVCGASRRRLVVLCRAFGCAKTVERASGFVSTCMIMAVQTVVRVGRSPPDPS